MPHVKEPNRAVRRSLLFVHPICERKTWVPVRVPSGPQIGFSHPGSFALPSLAGDILPADAALHGSRLRIWGDSPRYSGILTRRARACKRKLVIFSALQQKTSARVPEGGPPHRGPSRFCPQARTARNQATKREYSRI